MTALLVAVGTGTKTNDAGKKLTQAVFIAQEIREWTLRLPFSDTDPGDADNPPGPDGSEPQVFVDDLDDLMDVTYSPPRDGRGIAIAGMTDWSETITLTWRARNDISSILEPGASDLIHVQLDVRHKGTGILTTGWLVTRRE